jgi:Na+-translocating ferredoxin:NAD+ oxidoreductase subunit G
MKKIILFIILFTVSNFPQEIKERTESIIRSNFSGPVNLEMIKYELPKNTRQKIESAARQKFFSGEVYVYKIFSGNEIKGYAILDNVYGKSMPITFLVIFDPGGNVQSAEVIKYREQYGGAVQNRSWIDQFKGKNIESGYAIGKDVNTISGATISVNSLTAGIRKTVLLLNEIKNSL